MKKLVFFGRQHGRPVARKAPRPIDLMDIDPGAILNGLFDSNKTDIESVLEVLVAGLFNARLS